MSIWRYLFSVLAVLEILRIVLGVVMWDRKHGGKIFGTNVEQDDEEFNIYE